MFWWKKKKSKTTNDSKNPPKLTIQFTNYHIQFHGCMSQHNNFQASPFPEEAASRPLTIISNAPTSSATNDISGYPRPDTWMDSKQELVFYCKPAHGGRVGIVSGFTSITELYAKIAQCYDFPPEEILYCTLNTQEADMNSLLGGQLGLEDFIFAHLKGQRKEVALEKTDDELGLTITDNGASYCLIKEIKEGSMIDRLSCIRVGDHIEGIDSNMLIGRKHYEVSKLLQEIPKGTTFTMRLIEPIKAELSHIATNSRPLPLNEIVEGDEENFSSKCRMQIKEMPDYTVKEAVDKINNQLSSFIGIYDTELATQIWELGMNKQNPLELSEEIERSELSGLQFPEDFIFDVWGIISDARDGRL